MQVRAELAMMEALQRGQGISDATPAALARFLLLGLAVEHYEARKHQAVDSLLLKFNDLACRKQYGWTHCDGVRRRDAATAAAARAAHVDRALRTYGYPSPLLPPDQLRQSVEKVRRSEGLALALQLARAHASGDQPALQIALFRFEPMYMVIAMVDPIMLEGVLQALPRSLTLALTRLGSKQWAWLRSKKALIRHVVRSVRRYKVDAQPVLQDPAAVSGLLRRFWAGHSVSLPDLDLFEHRYRDVLAASMPPGQRGGRASPFAWIVYLVLLAAFFVPLGIVALLMDIVVLDHEKNAQWAAFQLLRKFGQHVEVDEHLDQVFGRVAAGYFDRPDNLPVRW